MLVNPQNNDNETALHCAAQYGHTEVVKALLEELTDPTMRNNKFETPLDLAALYGRLEVVKMLLSAHPNLLSCSTRKHTPLHLAARNGHKAVVQVLLDAGMDSNYQVARRAPLLARADAAGLCAQHVSHHTHVLLFVTVLLGHLSGRRALWSESRGFACFFSGCEIQS